MYTVNAEEEVEEVGTAHQAQVGQWTAARRRSALAEGRGCVNLRQRQRYAEARYITYCDTTCDC